MRMPSFSERSHHYLLPVSKAYNKQEWLHGGLSKHVLLSYDPQDSQDMNRCFCEVSSHERLGFGKMSIKKLAADLLVSFALFFITQFCTIQF